MIELTPEKVETAYHSITNIKLPNVLTPGMEVEIWSLLCSVHPKVFNCLDDLVKAFEDRWSPIRTEVERQKDTRSMLYQWLVQLDEKLKDDPFFVFPDPYSLLLWLWTFKVFETSLNEHQLSKYFFRGEKRDYDNHFMPTMARNNLSARGSFDTLLKNHESIITNTNIRDNLTDIIGQELALGILNCMSYSQTLAINQHYGLTTPLLDVTTNPEVALYFATQPCDAEIGVVGYWQYQDNPNESHKIALITVPFGFERIHRQSGYFICVPPTDLNDTPLVSLRFHRCPELEPFRPKCLATIGKCNGTDQEILSDLNNIEEILSLKKITNNENVTEISNRSSNIKDIENLLQFSVSTICALGRYKYGNRGRIIEIMPVLTYVFFRFAPAHFLFITKLINVESKKNDYLLLKSLSDQLCGILKKIYYKNTQDNMVHTNLTDEEILHKLSEEYAEDKLSKKKAKTFSKNELPYPVNKWYK